MSLHGPILLQRMSSAIRFKLQVKYGCCIETKNAHKVPYIIPSEYVLYKLT